MCRSPDRKRPKRSRRRWSQPRLRGPRQGFVDELRQKDAKVLHGIEIIAPDGKTLAIGETQ
jgi:hypothetical protein